jgi:peptide/nickel transport system ATP-binding protein
MSEHEGEVDEPRDEREADAAEATQAAEQPTEIAEQPTEVAERPTGAAEQPTEVAAAPTQPVAPVPPPAAPQPTPPTPAVDGNGDGGGEVLLGVEHLQVLFPIKAGVVIDRQIGQVHAVDDVSFGLRSGETLGVVGESGCGKTTLIRALVRLIEPTSGTVSFEGTAINKLGRKQMEPIRRQMQMVFQDPQASLNPRKRVGQILATPLQLRGVGRGQVQEEARALLDRVGLAQDVLNRFPHEFSGGQRQRIGIARALAVNPKLVLLDEPVSALDVSIQAQVINLLDELQDELHLSYVFVAHDLSVVRHVSNRIVVMYLGKLMEISPAEELYDKPIHPYTSALLGAIPIPDPTENRTRHRGVITGEPPNPINPPTGCRFHTRCPRASEICRTSEPPLTEYADGHLAACHHPQNVTQAEIDASTRSDQSPESAGSETPDLSPGSGLQSTRVSEPASAG